MIKQNSPTMQLSETEIKDIDKEVGEKFPYGKENNRERVATMRVVYRSAIISERVKANKLLKALAVIMSELNGEPSEENAAISYNTAKIAIHQYNNKHE